MSLHVRQRALLQWIASLLILGAAFWGPHMRVPAIETISYRSTQAEPTIANLFTGPAGAHQLSYQVRDNLLIRYGELYRNNPPFYARMLASTEAQFSKFNDFLMTDKGLLINLGRGTVAPGIEGPVTVQVPMETLLAYVQPQVIAEHFPELGPSYQEARLTQNQQHYTQALVNDDRSNINCAVMKCIALTFDDGPDGQNGRRIIQTLKDRKAVGTFFYMGSKVIQQPEEVREAYDNDNEIGNHSWSHPRLSQLKDADVQREVNNTDQVINEVIGRAPHFMRPPYADYKLKTLTLINRPIALWNVDPQDWAEFNSATIVQRTLAKAQPGSVVLFHSIYSRTADAIPQIVDQLQARGYVLVTMSELFNVNDENVSLLNGQRFFWR